MSDLFENRNDKQVYFNQIKGQVIEIKEGETFCGITLNVGHENCRQVNLSVKKLFFEKLVVGQGIKLTDKVLIKFYLISKNKGDRWYTTANVLDINRCD